MTIALGIGHGSTEEFYRSELSSLSLNDKRLVDRAHIIFTGLQNKAVSCIRRLFDCPKDARQAYDFFSNVKVSSNSLIAPHYDQTIARVAERLSSSDDQELLLIQDSCYINYTSHKAKVDIGRIGITGNTEQYGIIQHTNLVVTKDNHPLGLLSLQFYDNEEFIGLLHHSKRDIAQKRTNYWIRANM